MVMNPSFRSAVMLATNDPCKDDFAIQDSAIRRILHYKSHENVRGYKSTAFSHIVHPHAPMHALRYADRNTAPDSF